MTLVICVDRAANSSSREFNVDVESVLMVSRSKSKVERRYRYVCVVSCAMNDVLSTVRRSWGARPGYNNASRKCKATD
jgi:hypothetical protein